MSCASTVDSIQMPFDLWTRVGSRKHALYGAQIPTQGATMYWLGHGDEYILWRN